MASIRVQTDDPTASGNGREPSDGPSEPSDGPSEPSDGPSEPSDGPSLNEVAARVGVSPATLRRWVREGLIPQYDGDGGWSPGAVHHARIVVHLRERGHSLEDIRRATDEGRLAFGYIEELFPAMDDRVYTVKQAAVETGLEPVVERAGPHLEFERIGEVRLKGFTDSTEIFLARQKAEGDE